MFSHLHAHSEYSPLDGLSKVLELFQRAKELGQPAIAITDHGSTSALYDMEIASKKTGVKAILGTEFYYKRENDEGNGHLIVLAKNNIGLKNIFKLQEYGYTDNFYYKPRIDFESLIKHKEGLIVTSACLGSTFAQYLLNGDIQSAIDWARKFKEEFGDDFYLEVQSNSIMEQLEVNKQTIRIANMLKIKYILTNDVHYTYESDAYPHEVLLALQSKRKMDDEKRFKFSTQDFWLKSEQEMRDTVTGVTQEEVDLSILSIQEIVDKCNASLSKGKFLPDYYNIPDGETQRSLLVKEVTKGAREKGFNKNKEYMKDVQHEINIIDEEGYCGYFLIVQDYIRTARENGIIVGDGRGSGAGSKVIYLTDIARIEPNKYNLLFERFMDKGRTPDIDVDFSDQDAVFKDLQRKYGENSVARIVTFGKMTPKAVCRKVFSAFGHSESIIKIVTGQIPTGAETIQQAMKMNPGFVDTVKKYKELFDVIKRLEGVISQEGSHAGGIIIYPNLSDYLPVKTRSTDRKALVVAFDMDMIHELGFYKFDVLGLETLPVVKKTLDSIKRVEGIDIDLHSIDFNDENVYKMLSEGDVSGVFQLSAQAQKATEQNPRNFEDLIALNSLIRPGVGDWIEYIERRKGKEWSIHPDREYYMNETEGTMTYQEQFLLDCKTFAGWSVGFADKHVRKNRDIRNDKELREKFIRNSLNRGYSLEVVTQVWSEIEDAVDGGLNEAHFKLF